ncbi:MAG: PmoA family protein [Prolixibacteraceae bacterium]|nr:PmoA family protein [Prolixibacteraceae bacterium]
MPHRSTFIFLLLMLSIIVHTNAQVIHFEKDEGGFWIKQGETKVLFFQREVNDSVPEYARNNYFHPVYDLNGNVITEDFPEDHFHHRGIFWAWHQVSVNGEKNCDPWDIKNFEQKVRDIEFKLNEEGNGELNYTSYWYASNKPDDPFMREHTTVTVHPRALRYRQIDFEIELQALDHQFSIGGSDNIKGYGGFSFRLKTNANTEFYCSGGEQITPQNTAMKCGAFVNIINPELKRGVVIHNNPKNPEIAGWILRQDNSMQNCAWPGREPVDLLVEKPVTLRYSLLIHNGKLKKRAIDRIIDN